MAATALALPVLARAATLTVDDPLISIAECVDRSNQSVALTWDFSGSSGSTFEILASNASGCSETDATTAVLVDGLSTSRTRYPLAGDSAITLSDVLSGAGKSAGDCQGSDFRVYVCVRLLNSSGTAVATASAAIKFQLERPPAPVRLSVAAGEKALYVSFSPGTATTAAPAASKTYQAFASAAGVTHASGETTSTSDVRISGLENGTTYDVWVVAYSEAGNPSTASELSAGTPQHVLDFYDLYKSSGGSESGGCSHGGLAGLLSLIATVGLVRWTRRRERRGRMKGALKGLSRGAVALVAVVAAGPVARADPLLHGSELSLRFLRYKPAIDSEFMDGSRPFALAFGTGEMWGGRLEYARTLSAAFGTVGLGLGLGYFGAHGHGAYRDPATGEFVTSRDSTALQVFPASLFAMFRFDGLERWYGVPLAPYARASLERYMWRTIGSEQASHTGATNGYGFTLGIALFLDRVDPALTHELFRETGIRHTCLTLDATKAVVNDFGSAHSWNLSTVGWSLAGGLAFTF